MLHDSKGALAVLGHAEAFGGGSTGGVPLFSNIYAQISQ
jgi:hypothetical protein